MQFALNRLYSVGINKCYLIAVVVGQSVSEKEASTKEFRLDG